MSANVVNKMPYLRTSRNFPEDTKQLTVEVNKSYVDIANAVNNRTIGIFSQVNASITGEAFFINNQKYQSLRQFYTFTTTSAIASNIPISQIPYISRGYGQYKDSSGNWYGLIFGTSVAIAGQISFYLTSSGNITFVTGAGAPALSSGIIVLEWLSNV